MKNNIFLRIVIVAVCIVLIAGCRMESANISEEVSTVDRSKVTNLKAIDLITGKPLAQVLIDEIPEYKTSALNFTLADKYSPDYALTDTRTIEFSTESFTASTDATYASANTQKEIDVLVMHYPSAKVAQSAWIESVFYMYAIPELPLADVDGIIVGDVAVGMEDSLNFIRGNIGIRIWGVNGNSVVEVAQEIDAQIIKALEDAEKEIR